MNESARDEALRLAEEAGFRIEKPGKHATTQWEPFIDMDGMCTEECIKLISLSRQRPGWKWVPEELTQDMADAARLIDGEVANRTGYVPI